MLTSCYTLKVNDDDRLSLKSTIIDWHVMTTLVWFYLFLIGHCIQVVLGLIEDRGLRSSALQPYKLLHSGQDI